MKRNVDYTWRLREIMAQHGMFRVNDLIPHLVDRGINLSSSQVHRLVTRPPSGYRCRCWPRSATSSTSPPPT